MPYQYGSVPISASVSLLVHWAETFSVLSFQFSISVCLRDRVALSSGELEELGRCRKILGKPPTYSCDMCARVCVLVCVCVRLCVRVGICVQHARAQAGQSKS